MSNKIRVVYSGDRARVYLPNGDELRHVRSVAVSTPQPGSCELPSMFVEVSDFSVESEITHPDIRRATEPVHSNVR